MHSFWYIKYFALGLRCDYPILDAIVKVVHNRKVIRFALICCCGQLHREDGPAILWSDGTKEWYRHGVRDEKMGQQLNIQME